jgi:curved DNA-binding protein CbpA
LPATNPYEVLKVPRTASTEAIEEAYDRLFDQYEPKALEGDTAAVQRLNELNEARDILVDPRRRKAVDAQLSSQTPRTPSTSGRSTTATAAGTATTGRAPASAGTTIKAKPRARAVEPVKTRSLASFLPYFIIIAFLVFAISVALSFLLNRGAANPGAPPPGDAVATVNDQPIYQRELDERFEKDKANAQADPLYAAFFNNFQGITGTRALDLLKQDALDKLINMEVIVQQAKKEGFYPSEDQRQTLIRQAKESDLKNGQTFEDFLRERNISEEQYNKVVVENVVYTVMANEHMPKEGDADKKADGFIQWICQARQSYNVKILLTFTITDNPPCTSGLPSDLPLPGVENTPPDPIATVPPSTQPQSANTPAGEQTP